MKTALTPSSGRIRPAYPPRAGIAWAVVIATFGLTSVAHSHGDLDVQIQRVSQEIATAPSALLYLKRGELHHTHEDYASALIDYDRAAGLNASLDAVWFARGRTLFKSGQLARAREAMDRYLTQQPKRGDAYLLRARILSGLKRYPEAVLDFNRNLALAVDPLPECFLERADALAKGGDPLAALKSLDEAISRQGNLITLQNAAIALELTVNRHDAALARVDRVLADLQRKESWLERRGDILETAGRHDEARRTFAEALVSIDRLPVHHRDTKSMRDLQTRLRRKLGS